MKVQTFVKHHFGKHAITDLMDCVDEPGSMIEYYGIQRTEDASEPEYFVRLFSDGLYTIQDINGNTIIHTYNAKALKDKLKVLSVND